MSRAWWPVNAEKSHIARASVAAFVLAICSEAKPVNAPGTCVDCGNEAYIQLAGEGETMICAHCFADRGRAKDATEARREAVPAQRRAAG